VLKYKSMHYQTERRHIRSTLKILTDDVRGYGAAYLLPLLSETGKRFTLDNYKPEAKLLAAFPPLISSFEDEKRIITRLLTLADDGSQFALFSNLALLLSDKGYWYTLRHAYIGSDWLDQVPIEWKRIFFSSSKPHREFLMNEDEQKFHNSLPGRFSIYRGMSIQEKESGNFGVSWSLDEERANFFANDYIRHTVKYEKIVHSIEVKREDIIAYFNERHEQEVIYISKK